MSTKSPCRAAECDRPSKTRGMCGMHAERVRNHGTTALPPKPSALDKIMERVEIDGDGCWLWVGWVDQNGYGRLGGAWAHRLSYEAFHEAIPDGMQLDHLCRVPRCVNPDHLEPVTNQENQRRRYAATFGQDKCSKGHDLTDAYTKADGKRTCRHCSHINSRARYYRVRGLEAPPCTCGACQHRIDQGETE